MTLSKSNKTAGGAYVTVAALAGLLTGTLPAMLASVALGVTVKVIAKNVTTNHINKVYQRRDELYLNQLQQAYDEIRAAGEAQPGRKEILAGIAAEQRLSKLRDHMDDMKRNRAQQQLLEKAERSSTMQGWAAMLSPASYAIAVVVYAQMTKERG